MKIVPRTVIFIGVLFILAGCGAQTIITPHGEETVMDEEQQLQDAIDAQQKKPEQISQETNPVAELVTTKGVIRVELFADKAPKTTENFVKLARQGFYNGTIFHRVIPGFIIQGGDPTGTGRGGPGYTIPDEFGEGLRHDSAGILSMANAGPDTGGSQFFITVAPTPWLDGKHAIFGSVISGQEVVASIANVARNPADRPLEDITIEKIVFVSP